MPKVSLCKFYNNDDLYLIAIARKGGVDINSFSLTSSSLCNNEINLKWTASDLDSIIYAIEIIPIDIENQDYLLIAVSNNGLSFAHMNLSLYDKLLNNNPIHTKIINLSRRSIFPSIATISYISNHNCILVSIDNDIYLSSLLSECYSPDKDNNNKFIFDESKLSFKSGSKLNIIYECGRKPYHTFQPELCSIIESFEIINTNVKAIALIIKSDSTGLVNLRWCSINESLDQINIKWELDLGSDVAVACIAKSSYNIPLLYVANNCFIYVCGEIGIISKISCNYNNIIYDNICGLLSLNMTDDNNHNLLLSTSSGLYIKCSFIIPNPNDIISNSIQNGSMNGGKELPINKNVKISTIEVISGFINNNASIFDNHAPFLPYCTCMISLMADLITASHEFFLGYHDCYGIQLLHSTLEGYNDSNNINNKIDLIPFICDNYSPCDRLYGIDKTIILKGNYKQ
jgi:hypothetical protein